VINKEYLAKLAADYGITLTDAMLTRFDGYAELLVEWNERMNLTSITAPDEIVVKHFIDSLLLLKAYDLPENATVIDVGTGAGFPGIPLKIVRSDLAVTLLDSLQKRVGFLQEVSTQLDLGLLCVHARAEDAARDKAHRDHYDVATARAVASLPVLAEYCLPFVKRGGTFIAMKGRETEAELASSARAISMLGGDAAALTQQTLPGGDQRAFVTVKKISQTPAKYPRSAGKPQKAPL
jgi:16S rRNA (guanine(527)-N(7))-methyltransferase RsmG